MRMPISSVGLGLSAGSGGPSILQSVADKQASPEDIAALVKQKYRAIEPYDLHVIDSRDKGISQGRKLEFYPPDESDNPVPGKLTVQVFDPSFKGDDLINMIAADFLHHLGKNDPHLIKLRNRFQESLTAEQHKIDKRAYEEAKVGKYGGEPEKRPYDEWFNVSRLDQYLGSMFLPKDSPDRADWMGMMTPQQTRILAEIQHYMETGKKPDKSPY